MRRYFGYFKSCSLLCIQPKRWVGGKTNRMAWGAWLRISTFCCTVSWSAHFCLQSTYGFIICCVCYQKHLGLPHVQFAH